MRKEKTILVASLNWGLGHAARCIPIIKNLLDQGFNVLLASDGAALLLLEKEFPQLESIRLPSYDVRYPKIGGLFKWKMIALLPHFYKTMRAEEKLVKNLLASESIHGIISDGRLGIRHPEIPSVFITHQLNLITGSTTFFSRWLYHKIIKEFDVCWVPDIDHEILNLGGKLSHHKKAPIPVDYLGILSRMAPKDLPVSIDILALISGPEPQRSIFEEILIKELSKSDAKTILVRGVMEAEQKWTQLENVKIVNYMERKELENTMQQSAVVICRSGYSTIMDLAVLKKKAFFIPTPGQYEQKYLAKRLATLGIAPSCDQERFRLKELNKIPLYKGLSDHPGHKVDYSSLFGLF